MTPARKPNDHPHAVLPAVFRCSKATKSDSSVSREEFSNASLTGSERDCGFVASGSVSWEPNQARGIARRRVRTSEIFFLKSSAKKIFPRLAGSAWCYGRTSPASISRSASDAPSASPTSTSRARRRLPMKRSWPCSTKCARVGVQGSSVSPRHRALIGNHRSGGSRDASPVYSRASGIFRGRREAR